MSLKDMRTGQGIKYRSKKKILVPTFEDTVVDGPVIGMVGINPLKSCSFFLL